MSVLNGSREEATLAYWEISQQAGVAGDTHFKHTCIALLCTLGTACRFERLRAAAARRAIDLMPQPGEEGE